MAAARRAQVLVHTRYPENGWWVAPAYGLWAALFTASFAAGDWVQIFASLATAVSVGAFARYQTNRRGVLPSSSTAPAPLKAVLRRWFVTFGLVVAVVYAVFVIVNWWAASLLAGVAVSAILWDHDRRYALAARRAEAEAGIMSAGQ